MLDKTSEEYKKVLKLYKQGKISEQDLNRLLEALENYDVTDDREEDSEVKAERNVVQLLKDLGIKITSSLKTSWNTFSNATEKMADTIRTTIRNTANKIADNINGDSESESESESEQADPCRFPEEYDEPYEKLHIKLNYIGKKSLEITTKAKKQKSLAKKCEKVMSAEMCEKLHSLLAEQFVGKYEISIGDEYMRLLVRPKKQL